MKQIYPASITGKGAGFATGGSVLDKFRVMKELGYDGMELVSPWKRDIKDVRQAMDETGMPVHALVDMKQWEIRLSSPDSKIREQGVAILEQSLRDCHAFGGSAVLPQGINGTCAGL